MRRALTGSAFAWRPAWTVRARALFRTDDDRFTDDEILTILSAGEAGLKLADVCAARGIRPVTYYVWKAKYHGLSPADLRTCRLRERRKRQVTRAGFALVALSIGAAGLVIGMPNAMRSHQALANAPEATLETRQTVPTATASFAAPNFASAAAAGGAPQSDVVRQPAQEVNSTQRVGSGASARVVNTPDIKKADPIGYVVQVAAVPDLREARAVLEQLAEAGYSAYLTAKIVDRVELYRVRVGPLKSRLAAEEVARRLVREGHHSPWVTK
jgi:cell division septation protein DedD